MKKFRTLLAATATVLMVGCTAEAPTTDDTADSAAQVDMQADVLARVNGEAITQEQVEDRSEQIAQGQGQRPSDADVLNLLIEEALVFQAAANAGIAVTDEELDTEYKTLIDNSGGTEQVKAQLSQLGLSPAALRNDLRKQILIRKYIDAEVGSEGIEVTDAEVETTYNQAAATQQGLPPLDEVRDQIRAQLQQQKMGERVQQHVASLRTNADIVITAETGAETDNNVGADMDDAGMMDDGMGTEAGMEGEMEMDMEAEMEMMDEQ